MDKFLVISMLAGILGVFSGCATLSPPAQTGPETPATVVFFQPFSAALDAPALAAIATAASQANAAPDQPVLVTGAADTVGSKKANALLSRTRAQVVADTLEADGVAPSRIRVKGIGETTAPGTNLPGQFDRRALIQIGG